MRKLNSFIKHIYPLGAFFNHIKDYPTPGNLNYLWSFGAISGFFLVIQIATGIFLSMHYIASADFAFDSVEHIMRHVRYGWLVRYMHSNGASFFFAAVYIHMFRSFYYGSFFFPRGIVWASGVIMFILMMATAFVGYVLPWGQMSYWGATVITNLFSTVPVFGVDIVHFLWGGYTVDNPTLERFYSFHFFLPFIILAMTIIHIVLLHRVGSNNPLGADYSVQYIPFYPSFFVKDLFAFWCIMLPYVYFAFFASNALGHPDNYIEANPLVTPKHIVPEWYFLPFYAILRSIPNKMGGVIAMFSSLIVLFFLPFLNTSEIRAASFRPVYQLLVWAFFLNFIFLGWLGQMPAEYPFTVAGLLATFFLFFFFFCASYYRSFREFILQIKNLCI